MSSSNARQIRRRQPAQRISDRRSWRWVEGTLIVGGLLASQTLLAQQVEEVMVTATKYGETKLQETPLSISALGSEELNTMGVDSAGDFLRTVPGVTFEEQGVGDKKYIIRGVQSTGASTVAVYFDDIVLTANNRQDGGGRNVDPKLVDIERIEVLRGPQGTLYGAGSMTGTVRYIQKKPDLSGFGASVGAQISSTKYGGESYDFDGVLNLPVVDGKFGLRLVAYNRDDAGWIDKPLTGEKDVNNEDTTGVRVQALWEVSDALSLTASFLHQESSTNGRSAWQDESHNLPFDGYTLCAVKQTCVGEIVHSGQQDRWSAYNISANYDAGFGNFFLTSSLLDRLYTRSLDATHVISADRRVLLPDGSLDRFNSLARHMIVQPQDRSLWSNEARFSSGWAGPVQLITGVFYQQDENDFSSNSGSTDRNGYFMDESVRDNSLWRTVDTDVEHTAFFGELTYQLTDALSATVGARQYRFDVEEVSEIVYRCCSVNVPGTGPGPLLKSKDDGVNMKYNVSYKVNSDIMLYAQAAQGFRSGGTNEPAIQPSPGREEFCGGFGQYGSDSLWSYEIGAKTSWLNNTLTVNVTPYYMDWKDMQSRVRVEECRAFFIQNSGNAEVKGVEFETQWAATDAFEVALAMGYTDAKLAEDSPFQSGPLVDGRAGDEIPYTAKITGRMGLTYKYPLGALDSDLVLHGDWAYTGSEKVAFRDTDPRQREMPAYSLVNVRVGLVNASWRAALFVDNVFNDLSDVSRYPQARNYIGDYVFTNRPREVGLSLSKDF